MVPSRSTASRAAIRRWTAAWASKGDRRSCLASAAYGTRAPLSVTSFSATAMSCGLSDHCRVLDRRRAAVFSGAIDICCMHIAYAGGLRNAWSRESRDNFVLSRWWVYFAVIGTGAGLSLLRALVKGEAFHAQPAID